MHRTRQQSGGSLVCGRPPRYSDGLHRLSGRHLAMARAATDASAMQFDCRFATAAARGSWFASPTRQAVRCAHSVGRQRRPALDQPLRRPTSARHRRRLPRGVQLRPQLRSRRANRPRTRPRRPRGHRLPGPHGTLLHHRTLRALPVNRPPQLSSTAFRATVGRSGFAILASRGGSLTVRSLNLAKIQL